MFGKLLNNHVPPPFSFGQCLQVKNNLLLNGNLIKLSTSFSVQIIVKSVDLSYFFLQSAKPNLQYFNTFNLSPSYVGIVSSPNCCAC